MEPEDRNPLLPEPVNLDRLFPWRKKQRREEEKKKAEHAKDARDRRAECGCLECVQRRTIDETLAVNSWLGAAKAAAAASPSDEQA